jgi:hypothetical protein
MATGTSQLAKNITDHPVMSLGRKIRIALLLVAGLFLILLVYNFSSIQAQARLGASYAAHLGCSCRYIGERPLESCYSDFEPGMDLVSLVDDPENKRVTASVPLLVHAAAEYRGDFGCQQLNAKELDALN